MPAAKNKPKYTHTLRKSGKLQIIPTQVSISGNAIKTERIRKSPCPVLPVPSAPLVLWGPPVRLSWGWPELGLPEGREERGAPSSPHLLSTEHFCLGSPGSTGPQLTSAVYEIRGPERVRGKGTWAQKVRLPGTWR